MPKTSLGIALMTAAALTIFILATAGPASARCVDQYNRCMNSCAYRPDGRDGSARAACIGKCGLKFVSCCGSGATSGATNAMPPMFPPGTPPKKWGGQPPVNVGVNQPGGGSSSPPKGPIGLQPPVNVGVNQPGGGSGSGVTIYDKSGTGKSITTISGNGTTIETVYEENGNHKSTVTGAKGNVLSKTVYNKTGKIVSHSKGNKKVFLEEGTQKHKEKGTTQVFHEEKHNLKQLDSGSASSHPHGRHK